MTKFVLQKSPLAMVLIDLRFTTLPQQTVDQGLEAFKRVLFEQGFSDSKESEISQFELAPKSHNEFSVNQHSIKRFDCINILRNQGVTLTRQSLTLRSTVYDCFEEFKLTWDIVLEAFFSSFPNVENAGMQRLGLRHMDTFIPLDGESVIQYIHRDWLTNHQINSDNNSVFFNRRFMKTNYGILRVEIEERIAEGKMINLLPKDISDPEPVSLDINIRPHWQEINDGKYAIVDIDHAWQAERRLEPLKVSNIENKLQGLYQSNSDTFWSLLSEHAEEKWGKAIQ